MRLLLILTIVLFAPTLANGADTDSSIADNLYSQPLTHRELPLGYREKPIQWTPEPRGYRDNPIQWRPAPIGYREVPIPQLEEPRNGLENPRRFIEKDAILVANNDEQNKIEKDDTLYTTQVEGLRIERHGDRDSIVTHNLSDRYQGYGGTNPPSKARIPDFQ